MSTPTDEDDIQSGSAVAGCCAARRWPQVDRFAEEMKRELEANVPEKGQTWDDCPSGKMMEEVEYHVEKLRAAVEAGDKEKIREHAADVGNNAMMLADLVGVI